MLDSSISRREDLRYLLEDSAEWARGPIVKVKFRTLGITEMLLLGCLIPISAHAAPRALAGRRPIVGTDGPDYIYGNDTAEGQVIVARGGDDTIFAGEGGPEGSRTVATELQGHGHQNSRAWLAQRHHPLTSEGLGQPL